MAAGATSKRTYPWSSKLKDKEITFRLMERKDLDNALKFARELPADDLLFLSIDITDGHTLEQWVRSIEHDRAVTVLAEHQGRFVGYGSLTYNQLQWTRHLGEIRLLIDPAYRGMGLGKVLVNEVFALAQEKGLQKLIAHMAAEQKGAQQVFEHFGFHVEALLADHVIDRNGTTHDLLVMSYDVSGFGE